MYAQDKAMTTDAFELQLSDGTEWIVVLNRKARRNKINLYCLLICISVSFYISVSLYLCLLLYLCLIFVYLSLLIYLHLFIYIRV